MPFSEATKREALGRSHRHCCLCRKFGGRNVNVHHMIQEAAGGANTLDNAIVLCLTCHADVGHYNSQHPLGIKYHPDELKSYRDKWWEICASGIVAFKEIDPTYLWNHHELVFQRWDADARDLSRKIRVSNKPFNSTYGMREFVALVSKYVAEFLAVIAKDVEVEAGSGTKADLITEFESLLRIDEEFMTDKLAAVFPSRVGSAYLENVLKEGRAVLKNQYSRFTLAAFGCPLR